MLLDYLTPHFTVEFHGGHKPLTPEMQLLIFIQYISNMDCMREVGMLYGIAKSTVLHVVHHISSTMTRNLTDQVSSKLVLCFCGGDGCVCHGGEMFNTSFCDKLQEVNQQGVGSLS